MKIAKSFHWEMGHRLSFHQGKCINLHGHSYRLILEIEGEPDNNGMLIDFYDLKLIIAPIIEEIDHAFMVYEGDTELLNLIKQMKTKIVVTSFQSTVENISKWIAMQVASSKLPENITAITAKVYETLDAFAESRCTVN